MTVFSQTKKTTDTLGLPGDNLDLYAVLDLFQKSPTIEDFEKSLNEEKSKINNLDLDKDAKVDFIKVVTTKKDNDFTIVLQVPVTKTENQDVAVILVSKDKEGKVSMQIVGDKGLYGDNYIVEPKASAAAATANPGYTGAAPVTENIVATNTVVVEQSPVIVYMYSPTYVPYYPPYYYGYYPPYYHPYPPMSVHVYYSNHYANPYHHGGYGNTTVVVNHNTYNNYNNNSRNTSNTVNRNYPSTGNTANRANNTGANSGAKATNTAGNSGNKAANTGSKSGTKATNTGSNSGSKAAASPSTNPSSKQSANPSSTTKSTGSSSRGGGSRGGGGGRGRR